MNQPAAVPSALATGRRSARRTACRLGLAGVAAALLGAGLVGCASMNQISADVVSWGQWPAGRAPGRYAIERLPSQQQGGAEQLKVEIAARGALERAGFQRADRPENADVLVQLGAREGRVLDPWADWNWSWRVGGWRGPGPIGLRRGSVGWGWSMGSAWPQDVSYEVREVGLLLIDRAARTPLVETRVRYEARVVGDVLPALFDAALQGFPDLPAGERRVTVPLAPAALPASAPAN